LIIGTGDISTALTDREDVIFFASGVSDSSCQNVDEYYREQNLLFRQPKDKHLVYFSSLCIYYKDSMYANHKKGMEQSVKNHWASYTIVRLGNISWGKNPKTLINYLKAHPEAPIQNTYRHVISLEEFKYWMNLIIVPGRNEMNIPGVMWFVPDLFKTLKTEAWLA
jgi:hypothetical protein